MSENINTNFGIYNAKIELNTISKLLSENKIDFKDLNTTEIKPDFLNISSSMNLESPLDLFKTKANINIFDSLMHPSELILDVKTNPVKKSIIKEGVSLNVINSVNQVSETNWVGKLASNGGRDVAIIVPKNFDPSKPTEIIYHFHGHNGTIPSVLTGNNGLKNSLDKISTQKNFVLVVPQGPTKEKDHIWMNGKNNEDMSKFESETLDIIKKELVPNISISSITIEGHSAGGLPILNASNEGKLKANKVTFMDSSYGNWASNAYSNIISNNPNTKFSVVYIPGTQTQTDALKLQGKRNVTIFQSSVNHGSVPKTFFGV